ncbi:tRNA pseudouridine(13) synthase TruD [Candidatus Woesearchaeota archaeon]|nr:tRNA pseudouridine(13) synthase TruD [Candidatus Woesearchaeota archaeon]
MTYKIKQIPEDFIVDEISNVKSNQQGRFLYVEVKKKNRNTLDVVKELAKQLKIPLNKIGFAGSKDKHAITTQLFSIANCNQSKLKEVNIDNVTLKFLGYGNEPITLGDLEGNRFTVTVRNLNKIPEGKIDFCENYFDEQRFSKNNKQVGEFIVRKQFKEAVELLELPVTQNNYVGSLQKIPKRLSKLYVHSYQSYLFNQSLQQYVKNGKKVEYSLGTFIFGDKKEDIKLPLPGFGVEIKDQQILKKENITLNDFIIKQFPELSMEGTFRDAYVKVKEFSIETENDELNNGKKKAIVKFILPKSCYATIVIKKLFA